MSEQDAQRMAIGQVRCPGCSTADRHSPAHAERPGASTDQRGLGEIDLADTLGTGGEFISEPLSGLDSRSGRTGCGVAGA